MGAHRDPFFIEASPYGNPFWRGAYPEYTFPNNTKKPPEQPDARVYQAPNLQFVITFFCFGKSGKGWERGLHGNGVQ